MLRTSRMEPERLTVAFDAASTISSYRTGASWFPLQALKTSGVGPRSFIADSLTPSLAGRTKAVARITGATCQGRDKSHPTSDPDAARRARRRQRERQHPLASASAGGSLGSCFQQWVAADNQADKRSRRAIGNKGHCQRWPPVIEHHECLQLPDAGRAVQPGVSVSTYQLLQTLGADRLVPKEHLVLGEEADCDVDTLISYDE